MNNSKHHPFPVCKKRPALIGRAFLRPRNSAVSRLFPPLNSNCTTTRPSLNRRVLPCLGRGCLRWVGGRNLLSHRSVVGERRTNKCPEIGVQYCCLPPTND